MSIIRPLFLYFWEINIVNASKMINYTPFNERITSDRMKTRPFCAGVHSVIQRYIACYAQTEIILDSLVEQSIIRVYLKTLLKSILKWFPSYCKKKWINAQFTRGAVIQTFLFFTSSKIASILSSTKYWEKKRFVKSISTKRSIDRRTHFLRRLMETIFARPQKALQIL